MEEDALAHMESATLKDRDEESEHSDGQEKASVTIGNGSASVLHDIGNELTIVT